MVKTFYSSSVDEVINELNSDKDRGLSYKQLSENVDRYGENKIKISMEKGAIRNIFKIRDFYLLLIALVVSILYKSYILSGVMVAILLVKITLRVLEYRRKKKKSEQLSSLNYTDVSIIRSGVRDTVKADILTVGDLVFLAKGNIISADIRIIEEKNLTVNERNITSVDSDVRKHSTRVERVKSLSEINNMVFRGTRVAGGSAKGIVVNIGNDTQIGRLLSYLKVSDLRSKIIGDDISLNSRFTVVILTLVCIFTTVTFLILDNKHNSQLIPLIWFLASTVNLGTTESIYFKMKKRSLNEINIDIESIEYLERLERIDVFFIPKVSALTENSMDFKVIYTSEEIIDDMKNLDTRNTNIERVLEIGILNNNSIFNREENKYSGSIIDGSILKFCNSKGIFKATILGQKPNIFNRSDDGIRTSVNRVRKNYRASVKGYVDEVLNACKYIMSDGMEREITDADIEKIRMIDFNISNKSYETVGFVYRSFSYEPSEDENIESNLVFVGIVGFENQIKDNAKEMIQKLKNNNVLPIMITDDNKITAARLAMDLNIAKGMEEVISGVELLALEKDGFIDILSRTRVLCRITPAIKSKIISLFTSEGYSVAAVGGNLSDMPSVILSDVGIVSGEKPAKLLKKMSSFNIKENMLESFLVLSTEGIKLVEYLGQALSTYKSIFIYQLILLIYSIFMFDKIAFSTIPIVIFNILIIPLISYLEFNVEDNYASRDIIKELITVVIRVALFILAVSILKKYLDISFVSFTVMYYFIMISVLIRSIDIKNTQSKKLSIINILVFLTFIGCYVFILKSINLKGILILIGILIIYTIIELILKRWQKSHIG